METKQALEVLIQVALLAQSKGILSLDEAVIVKQSIDVFTKKEEVKTEKIENDEEAVN